MSERKINKTQPTSIHKQSPLKQIRRQCVNCCCGSTKTIRFCADTDCPLWLFRFGMSPKAWVRKKGDEHAQLFIKKNFESGGKYSPDQLVDEMEV